MMHRQDVVELLEDPSLPPDVVAKAYSDLARTQRWLGNTTAILKRLKAAPGVSSVIDLGCGQGALLAEIRRELGVHVTGIDLRPGPESASVPIVTGDVVVDPLPRADVALSVCMAHHLSETQIIQMIHNVSRSCRRFIVLDLVRHRLPLVFFSSFARFFLSPINVADGATSIRRAYTPREFRAIADRAVKGSSARVLHTVAPFYARQILDISW
jgi:SAM-dependent methyltransferase